MTPELLSWISTLELRADSVLEIGAFNVNGSARSVVSHHHWFGTDMREGPDVDFVCRGEDLPHYFGPLFDLVVMCEILEHAEDWRATLLGGWKCLRPGGRLLLSTPGPDFPQHDYPHDYHRFTLDFWAYVFKRHWMRNNIDIFYPHNGNAILVEKRPGVTHSLNLEHNPLPVP